MPIVPSHTNNLPLSKNYLIRCWLIPRDNCVQLSKYQNCYLVFLSKLLPCTKDEKANLLSIRRTTYVIGSDGKIQHVFESFFSYSYHINNVMKVLQKESEDNEEEEEDNESATAQE